MFYKTFTTTIKKLIRSASFWLAFSVFVIITIYGASEGFYIGDDAPDMVLKYHDFVECVTNSIVAKLLMYSAPIFTVITVVLVLLRDYGDSFFEIEKAAGISPFRYLAGRLTALALLNFLVLVFMNMLCLHYYVFTRGGVDGMSISSYLWESTVRLLRVDLFVGLPSLLFYIGLTYCVGTLFKNGIPAAVVSMGYTIMFYASYLMFRRRIAAVFFEYLSPIPKKLRGFFQWFDTDRFELGLVHYDTSLGDMLLCVAFLTGCSLLFSLISYFRIRKRTV